MPSSPPARRRIWRRRRMSAWCAATARESRSNRPMLSMSMLARRGAVFRIERHGPEFLARRISGVAIFPCESGRDEAGERARGAAFDKGGAERVTRLYRRDDLPEDQCLLRAPGWCLAYR